MKYLNSAVTGCLLLTIAACSNIDFKKSKGGMPYKVIASANGQEIDSGNIVKFNVVTKLRDSVLYSTYKTGVPQYMFVSANGRPYDYTEVLPSLKQGDSLYALQLMDTFIARNPQMVPPQFKKGDTLKTSIKILSVFKTEADAQKDQMREFDLAFDRDTATQNQLQKDIAQINQYLSSNNINAEKNGKGTYVQIINPGNGAQAADGKFVSLKYKGSTFGGTVFDTNIDSSKGHTEPMVYQVGAPNMIRGFNEGVRVLRQGAKAKLFIPSMLGYGPQPPSPEIKPFENLIFDIEVLQVSDQPIPQPMRMPPAMRDSAARR